ncbi:MAG TPA: glycerol-3-phosphate acyltransferase [Dehalococcoidia bacterium]|nr:glycerol-3-phosphate acyltransferase [Dehalococcoidia bacterium]
MIHNEIVSGVIAIVVAYLVGAFPTAYVTTRLFTGKDIRQVGSGNVGANNTFREVGPAAGVIVGVVDIGKGTAAVAVAHAVVGIPFFALNHEYNYFLVIAGLAAVAGHVWPVYLRFTGGNGVATAIGTLIILLPRELGIVCAVILLLWAVTRNLIMSVYISWLTVPLAAWFLEKDWLYVGYSLAMIAVLVLVFIPTARAALVKAGSRENLMAELLRRDKR